MLKESFMIGRPKCDSYYLIGKSTMSCVLGLALLSLMCPTSADAQNQMRIEYGETTSPELIDVKSITVSGRFLENAAKFVENTVALPPMITLTLATVQCDETNFFYNPETKTITFCYEMILYVSKRGLKSVEQFGPAARAPIMSLVRGATLFLVLHEIGHAFIDIHNLPVPGRGETVADQYAAIFLLDMRKSHPSLKYSPLVLMMAEEAVNGAVWFL